MSQTSSGEANATATGAPRPDRMSGSSDSSVALLAILDLRMGDTAASEQLRIGSRWIRSEDWAVEKGVQAVHLERVSIAGFQSFGPKAEQLRFDPQLTAFVGVNGAGKTSACQALLRMFSVVKDQRALTLADFHVPENETEAPTSRRLQVDAVFAFPELDDPTSDAHLTVPEFFRQMTAQEDGALKVRIVLEAEWNDDGSPDGVIASSVRVVHTFEPDYGEKWVPLRERGRIQAVYVPATRDGAKEITAFLRGRLWRASQWSADFRTHLSNATEELTSRFQDEDVVARATEVIASRWQELHHSAAEFEPTFRPVSKELRSLVSNAELLFDPAPGGRSKNASELSDGQRALLHIAITSATLDLEREIVAGEHAEVFELTPTALPTLTLLILEEPENNLSPYFLSRVVEQLISVTGAGGRSQAIISSHSASAVTRVSPERIRHFRLRRKDRTTRVRELSLPDGGTDVGKYIRQAVHAFPEIYFARYVVLAEGDSETIALPILAGARGIHIDQSFVAVVPLGGRHTNHFWRLLRELRIPHATLLDLDWGRAGGGEGRLRDACNRLVELGYDPFEGAPGGAASSADLNGLDQDQDLMKKWLQHLEGFGLFFATPLDLDSRLLYDFPEAYHATVPAGGSGPSSSGDPRKTVLGKEAARPDIEFWDREDQVEFLRWYRYLFQTNSKPSTHLLALSKLSTEQLSSVGGSIGRLLDTVGESIAAR
ncbi:MULTISPECIES: ATP-dependent nuclease [unclassified Microbacterium]|uniref:ATP-dependent nuclease n=1 Tax=unclassified Microbacterium TaxID=2609290 RepID=UPI00300FF86B